MYSMYDYVFVFMFALSSSSAPLTRHRSHSVAFTFGGLLRRAVGAGARPVRARDAARGPRAARRVRAHSAHQRVRARGLPGEGLAALPPPRAARPARAPQDDHRCAPAQLHTRTHVSQVLHSPSQGIAGYPNRFIAGLFTACANSPDKAEGLKYALELKAGLLKKEVRIFSHLSSSQVSRTLFLIHYFVTHKCTRMCSVSRQCAGEADTNQLQLDDSGVRQVRLSANVDPHAGRDAREAAAPRLVHQSALFDLLVTFASSLTIRSIPALRMQCHYTRELFALSVAALLRACEEDAASGLRHALLLWRRMRALRPASFPADATVYTRLLKCVAKCSLGVCRLLTL